MKKHKINDLIGGSTITIESRAYFIIDLDEDLVKISKVDKEKCWKLFEKMSK